MQETPEEQRRIRLYQAFAIIVSALGLSTACGLGLTRITPPPPPPLPPRMPHLIRVSTDVLRFPSTAVGARSEALIAVLTSQSAVPLRLKQVSLAGEQPASFHHGETCAQELAPGARCEVLVVFQPVSPGDVRASLVLDWVDGENQTIKLTGRGRVPVR